MGEELVVQSTPTEPQQTIRPSLRKTRKGGWRGCTDSGTNALLRHRQWEAIPACLPQGGDARAAAGSAGAAR